MNIKLWSRLALFVLCFGAMSHFAFAQKFEIFPYASYANLKIWSNPREFKSSGIYGVKGGWNVTPNLQLGGTFGVMNRLEPEKMELGSRGVLWEGNGSYHFFPSEIKYFVPYLTAGAGVLHTVSLDQAISFSRPDRHTFWWGKDQPYNEFFTFSYGAGVKAQRIRGPLGFRAELRVRTVPDFLGYRTSWIEPTAGVTFTWGER